MLSRSNCCFFNSFVVFTVAFVLFAGYNAIIGELLEEADNDIYENLNELLQGNAITTYIDTSVIYPEIRNNPSSVYSFLLVAGYLKVWETGLAGSGDLMCKNVRIAEEEE